MTPVEGNEPRIDEPGCGLKGSTDPRRFQLESKSQDKDEVITSLPEKKLSMQNVIKSAGLTYALRIMLPEQVRRNGSKT